MKKLLNNKKGIAPAIMVAIVVGGFALLTPLLFGAGIIITIKLIIDKVSTNPLLAVGVIVGLIIALKLFKK